MQNESDTLDFLKKSISKWEPTPTANFQEVLEGESQNLDDITSCFEFAGLLEDLRTELKIHKSTEARLLTDIKIELDGLEHVVVEKDIFQSVEQSVARLNNEVQSYQGDAKQLAINLKTISVMAESISSRVSALDQARSRLVKCLQRINDLKDLRTCAEGVEIAMKQEEYDEAARHVQKFFALDSILFKNAEQIDTKETLDSGQSMQECFNILREASANLKVIIEKKFDEARQANDFASMERFFKIFPLINEHYSGLQRFGNYICSKIEKLGEENFKILQAGGTDDKRKNVIYADTLTLIFEGIARMIELHQPLIDTFYGPDKLLYLMEVIQTECDKQTIRVINAFIEKRQFENKAKIVSNYLWSNSSGNAFNLTNNIEKINPLDLDILLSEVTLMHTRSELYWRFLKRRLGEAPSKPLNEISEKVKSPPQSPKPNLNAQNSPPLSPISMSSLNIDLYEEDDFYDNEEQKKEALEKALKQRLERSQKLDALLNRTALSLKMQELIGKYLLIEQYYMMESIKKAIEMDDVEEGSLTSTLLDDVFFIVRKSIRRSICSTSVDCVCAMLNNGVTLLETEFIRHVNSPIRVGYPTQGWTVEAYQTAQSAYNVVIQQGKQTAESGLTGVEKQKSEFLIALNNLRASIECVFSLKEGLNEDFTRHLNQISSLDKSKLENSVSQMDDMCKKLEYHVNLGIGKLCEAAFQSKIKSNAEVYININHTLNEELLEEYEISDPFMENFISLLDKHIAQFENLLLPENYQALLIAVAIETVAQLEKVIYKCFFNRFGGLQLDKEYRQLTSYLTSIAGWSVREKCSRLSQIVSILNSENFEEAVEFIQHQLMNGSFSTEGLLINEMKRVLSLRAEFPRDKIKALKL